MENHHKKKSYWGELVDRALEDVQMHEVIAEVIGGVMIGYFFLKSGIAANDEKIRLYIEAVAFAVMAPLIAFLLRLIFITPAKLYSDLAEKFEKMAKGKPVAIETRSPKESDLMRLLLCLCACLILIVAIENVFPSHEQASETIAAKEPPKPLPEKVIPKPENPPQPSPVSVAKTTPESPTQFERYNAETDDIDSAATAYVNQFKSDNEAKAEADRIARAQSHQAWWTNSIPYLRPALVILHDILTKEAAKHHDGVEQPTDYFQSLPTTMDISTGELEVSEIKFQNNTNMDFLVSLSAVNFADHRQLEISCGAGSVGFEVIGNTFLRRILNIPTLPGNGLSDVKIEKSQDFIKNSLKLLISAQILQTNQTNSVTH